MAELRKMQVALEILADAMNAWPCMCSYLSMLLSYRMFLQLN